MANFKKEEKGLNVDWKGLGIATAIIGVGLLGSYALATYEQQRRPASNTGSNLRDKFKFSNPFKKN